MGMVRASFGLYTSRQDVDFLVDSLTKIIKNKDFYITQYTTDNEGNYFHKEFKFSSKDFFSLTGTIDKDISTK